MKEKHVKIAAFAFLGFVALYYISKKGGLKAVMPALPEAVATPVNAAAAAVAAAVSAAPAVVKEVVDATINPAT